MRTESSNRLTMLQKLVSARCEATSFDRYAWIWVYPFRDGRFSVDIAEIEKSLVDDEEDVGEDQIVRRRLGVVDTLREVDELVKSANVDPDTLDAPWHSNFPL